MRVRALPLERSLRARAGGAHSGFDVALWPVGGVGPQAQAARHLLHRHEQQGAAQLGHRVEPRSGESIARDSRVPRRLRAEERHLAFMLGLARKARDWREKRGTRAYIDDCSWHSMLFKTSVVTA
eukprot:6178659-Pleurochrysis_carterae.AAC.1